MRVTTLLALSAGTVSAGVINDGSVNAGTNHLQARTFCLLSGLLPSLFGSLCPTPTPAPAPTTRVGTGPCANGANPISTYTTSNGNVYGICANTDFYGGDITSKSGIYSSNSCADVCALTSGCIGGTWNIASSVCWLKSSLAPPTSTSAANGICKISSGPTTTPVKTTTASTTPAAPVGTGLCANGAGPSSTYTSSSGDVYGVCTNTNFWGSDVVVTQASSNTACADLCSQNSACGSTTFSKTSGTCYLKSGIPGAVSDSTYDSTYRISTKPRTTTTTPVTTTSAAPVGTGRCANGAGPSYIYTSSSGDTYGVCPNTNLPGSDLVVTQASSNTACADLCSQNSACGFTTFSKTSGTCYLKSGIPAAATDSTYDSTYLITSKPRTTTTTTTPVFTTPVTTTSAAPVGTGRCANGAGPSSTYTASNGDVYGICPNTDFNGGDISNVGNIPSANACADACSATSGCVGASFLRSASICYLKSGLINPGNFNNQVDGIYKISSGTVTTTPVKTTTTAAASTTAQATTTSAAPGSPVCGVAGYDKQNPAASKSDSTGSYNTFSSCKTYCQGSSSFAVGGNYCLCYSAPAANNVSPAAGSPYIFYDMSCPAPSGASTTTTKASTTAVTTTASATGTGICAGGVGPSSTYTASNGDVYGVCAKTDFPGGDLTSVSSITSANACAEACSKTSGCVGGTFNSSASFCYLKSTLNSASSSSNNDSVYKISSGTKPSGITTTSSATVCAPTATVTVTATVYAR